MKKLLIAILFVLVTVGGFAAGQTTEDKSGVDAKYQTVAVSSHPFDVIAITTADQAIPALTETVLKCDSETIDAGNNHSTSTGKITVPVAGLYYFHYDILYLVNQTNGSTAWLQDNSGIQYGFHQTKTNEVSGSMIKVMAAGATMEVRVYTADVATFTFNAQGPCRFSATRIN